MRPLTKSMMPRPLPIRANSASDGLPPSHSGCSRATLWYALVAVFTRSRSRRGARLASTRSEPQTVKSQDEMLDGLLLTPLEHGQIWAIQDEVLVDELQHRHLMPSLRVHGDIAGADR